MDQRGKSEGSAMTREEFQKEVDAFWSWTSKTDRPLSAWYLSLEDYARDGFNHAYAREQKEKESQSSD